MKNCLKNCIFKKIIKIVINNLDDEKKLRYIKLLAERKLEKFEKKGGEKDDKENKFDNPDSPTFGHV